MKRDNDVAIMGNIKQTRYVMKIIKLKNGTERHHDEEDMDHGQDDDAEEHDGNNEDIEMMIKNLKYTMQMKNLMDTEQVKYTLETTEMKTSIMGIVPIHIVNTS